MECESERSRPLVHLYACEVGQCVYLRCTSSPSLVHPATAEEKRGVTRGRAGHYFIWIHSTHSLTLCSFRINSHYTRSELISQRRLMIPGTKLTPAESRGPLYGLIVSDEWMAAARWPDRLKPDSDGARVQSNPLAFVPRHHFTEILMCLPRKASCWNRVGLKDGGFTVLCGNDGGVSEWWARVEELRPRWKGTRRGGGVSEWDGENTYNWEKTSKEILQYHGTWKWS